MLKLLVILVLGLVVGYSYGFRDAKKHDRTIFVRSVERIGGSSRDKVRSNVDSQMDSLEAPSRRDSTRR
jgi:hypothetical protein